MIEDKLNDLIYGVIQLNGFVIDNIKRNKNNVVGYDIELTDYRGKWIIHMWQAVGGVSYIVQIPKVSADNVNEVIGVLRGEM